MNVANVAFQRSKISDRNTPKQRQDPANEVALYEEGFDFVLREIFFIVFGFALPFFVIGQKFSSPFLITNYTEVRSKFILPRSHSSLLPLRWLHVSWAPKPHWFIMYCAYRNWSLDERFCLKPIYFRQIIWNSLNRIQ